MTCFLCGSNLLLLLVSRAQKVIPEELGRGRPKNSADPPMGVATHGESASIVVGTTHSNPKRF